MTLPPAHSSNRRGPQFIEGLENFRDAGGFAVSPTHRVRKGMIFRSANPKNVKGDGFLKLHEVYGIKAIFDLRHSKFDDESIHRTSMAGPILILNAPAVEVFEEGFLQRHFDLLMTDHVDALSNLYMYVLHSATDGFRMILNFIRDNPNQPFLVNCELGKDRTGVFIAVVLLVLGVSDEDIIEDFGHSEKAMPNLLPGRKDKLAKVLSSENVSLHPVALDMHFSAVPEAMRAFLLKFRAKHGSGELYLRGIGFTEEDVQIIQNNLTAAM